MCTVCFQSDAEDEKAKSIALVMYDAAVLRSGYTLKDSLDFSERILNLLYGNIGIDPDTPVSLASYNSSERT